MLSLVFAFLLFVIAAVVLGVVGRLADAAYLAWLLFLVVLGVFIFAVLRMAYAAVPRRAAEPPRRAPP
jgi:quinol-cytochrome oxidoreductase complex cytochrome b subunit